MLTDKKKGFWYIAPLALVALLAMALPILSADEETDPFPDRQRPPVNFLEEYHDAHMESQECLACHHKYEDGENVLDESDLEEDNPDIRCASCHNASSDNDPTDPMEAYHRQCMGCHDELSAKGEETGPSLCGECHIRQKNKE
ncbi:MAG: cytochrome c3 family protein [Thermodesulfobacteriota bacterium]